MPQCKASVVLQDDNNCVLVAETPSEVHELLVKALFDGRLYVALISGIEGPWNGREIYLRVDRISAILPPMEHTCESNVTIGDD